MREPAKIFYAYDHRDELLRNELEKHLIILQRQGLVTTWYYEKTTAGAEWKSELDNYLYSADIILILISADFLASDICYNNEMTIALNRHRAGEAIVIPIIIRPVDWKNSQFGVLQAITC